MREDFYDLAKFKKENKLDLSEVFNGVDIASVAAKLRFEILEYIGFFFNL